MVNLTSSNLNLLQIANKVVTSTYLLVVQVIDDENVDVLFVVPNAIVVQMGTKDKVVQASNVTVMVKPDIAVFT